MIACTVTNRERRPFSSVLSRSFLEQERDARFFTLVADIGEDLDDFVISPVTIGVPPELLTRMAILYSPSQLTFALAPWLLRWLLKESGQPVLWIHDGSRVFAPLLDHFDDSQPLILGARLNGSTSLDSEFDALQVAGFGGLVRVGRSSGPFLDWWCNFSARVFEYQPDRRLERLLDLAPSAFDCQILRDPGVGASIWTLVGDLDLQPGDPPTIAGHPLRLFHFYGFDPREAHLATKDEATPEVLLSEHPVLNQMHKDYAEELHKEWGHSEAYGFDRLADGTTIDPRMRRLFARSLRRGEDLPSPFAAQGSRSFISWLQTPDPHGKSAYLNRYLMLLYEERMDLHAILPNIALGDVPKFLAWLHDYGVKEESVPSSLLMDPEMIPSFPQATESGINLIGYLRAELGVGTVGRAIADAIAVAGMEHATWSYGQTLSRQDHLFEDSGVHRLIYDTNILAVNADQMPGLVRTLGAGFFDQRRSIGIWWWEVEEFPEDHARHAEVLSEIWVGSPHIRQAIERKVDIPVLEIPIPILAVDPGGLDRASLGLPDGYLFLFTFDFLSIMERKNPGTLIDAFRTAFPEPGDVHLVIKTVNGRLRISELEALRDRARGCDNIQIIDRYFSPLESKALVALCDCYISLHRAEGFGLGMAEAMAAGKPVIATGYSGNLAYMNVDNSYLVDFELVPIGPGFTPYPENARWAAPDIDHAASLMRHVVQDPTDAANKGETGRRWFAEQHSLENAAEFIRGRMIPQTPPEPKKKGLRSLLGRD